MKVAPDKIFSGFDAYKKLIDSGVDMVVIATPPGFRPIHFEYAVKQGKNIFAEKPVATDAPGVRRFMAADEEAKKKGLQGCHRPAAPSPGPLPRHHQTHPGRRDRRSHPHARLLEWHPPLGPPARRSLKQKSDPSLSEMEYQMRNWYYFNWLCGDHIDEQHIHNLDVINWVKNGHPVESPGRRWQAGGHRRRIPAKSTTTTWSSTPMPTASKLLSECRHQHDTLAKRHRARPRHQGLRRHQRVPVHELADGKTWKSTAKGKDPYQQEHDDFCDAIRNNKPYNEAEYGAYSTLHRDPRPHGDLQRQDRQVG